MKKTLPKFYGYFLPTSNQKGVTDTWAECEAKVKNVQGARFKGFSTREAAQQWIDEGSDYSNKETFSPGVYFDAGTGRGNGVEVSVTDEKWQDLLSHVLPKSYINRYGKHSLPEGFTNNYGELLGCYLALQIALKLGIKKVYGDSSLVIDYWSKGMIKKEDMPEDTIELSRETTTLRKKFESQGGRIEKVSGDANPADLGFH
ncbi:MAG: ribonuclease H family protein [bacterium]|nr:ribonuclease H family protein [bacterium]